MNNGLSIVHGKKLWSMAYRPWTLKNKNGNNNSRYILHKSIG